MSLTEFAMTVEVKKCLLLFGFVENAVETEPDMYVIKHIESGMSASNC